MGFVTKYVSGILLIIVFIFIGFEKNFFDFFSTPEQIIAHKWNRDLQNLNKKGFLHKNFSQIFKVQFSYSAKEVEDFFKKVQTPELIQKTVLQNKNQNNSEFILEVFIDSLEKDSKKQMYMIQLNLINQKTGNTVWELSRTY